ncbi:MAG: tetratricopeptide repeat protein [Thermodesulfobacteriota bacterium]
MQNKNTVIGIVVAVIVLIVGIGGYIAGKRSAGDMAGSSVYNNSGAAKAVSQPANHSSLVSDLEARLKENPDDIDALQTLADTYFSMKRYDDAINYYKKVAVLSPENIDIYNEIGLSLHYKGESGEALKYIEKGLKKNPYHQRMWLTRGFILAYGVGDLKDAAKAWEKAKALDPASNVGKAAADYLVQINKEADKK